MPEKSYLFRLSLVEAEDWAKKLKDLLVILIKWDEVIKDADFRRFIRIDKHINFTS